MRLAEIEGIGTLSAAKLEKIGVRNVAHLLERGSTRKGRAELSEASGMDSKRILRWVNMADLMRIKGVGEEYSDLLEAAGVDTVKELRKRKADNLYEKMRAVNAEKNLVRQTPGQSAVEDWIEQAKELPEVIKY
jgi:predicted flap endonuclease-1-like 5' DNA nuclease